jgi:hypothetical protein
MTITAEKPLHLTAYNKDVQRFIMHGGSCSTVKKRTILEAIEESVINGGISFEKLFPPKTKRQEVLDYIIFLLSGSGICKVNSKTIAEKVGCTVRTVSNAVKNIKETKEILVCGLADGKNKYVFVLKSHPNFKSILKEVFFLDNAEQIAETISEQQNRESVGTLSVVTEKSSSNHNNFFISKQEKDIIRDSIETEVKVSNDYQQYFTSNMQNKLYHQILSLSYPKVIMDNAGHFALRAGNIDEKGFVKALKAVSKIAKYIEGGMDIKYPLAVFECELKADAFVGNAPEKVIARKIVPFYNWLEERD